MASHCFHIEKYNMRFFTCTLTLLLLVIPIICLLFEEACVSAAASTHHRCHPEEKKALLNFKKALKNAPAITRSWLPETDCCEWYGISCTDTDNHIFGLTLMDGDDFSGPIPDAIGDLPYLTAINFANISALTGSIPFSITKLQNLEILEIVRSNLTGTIPGFLWKLKKLSYIDLSYNKLTGRIPSSLPKTPKLSFLNLRHNRLAGPIPESFVKLKANNLMLLLSHNKLSGEIPPSFRDINFSSIDFSYNRLRGDVSMLFGRNKTTDTMNFARNKLEFNMSGLHLQLSPVLIVLDVSHNKIYGSLPSDIIGVWQSLNVSYNRLCGPIPKFKTHYDYSCFFHNRCLCGAPLNVTCK